VNRKRSVACLAVALSTGVGAQAATAKAPVFWSKYWVQKQVYKKYENYGPSVACAPVGPLARSHGGEVFGEFACDVNDGITDYVVAVVPTGTLSWRALKPGEVSPVSVPLKGIAAAGASRRLALMSYPDDPGSLMLDDQSVWKVANLAGKLAHWKPGDVVTIQPNTSKKHYYRVVNKTRANELEADFRGFG
jgi:hypothetical protein